jgi:hypothetical protein
LQIRNSRQLHARATNSGKVPKDSIHQLPGRPGCFETSVCLAQSGQEHGKHARERGTDDRRGGRTDSNVLKRKRCGVSLDGSEGTLPAVPSAKSDSASVGGTVVVGDGHKDGLQQRGMKGRSVCGGEDVLQDCISPSGQGVGGGDSSEGFFESSTESDESNAKETTEGVYVTCTISFLFPSSLC